MKIATKKGYDFTLNENEQETLKETAKVLATMSKLMTKYNCNTVYTSGDAYRVENLEVIITIIKDLIKTYEVT